MVAILSTTNHPQKQVDLGFVVMQRCDAHTSTNTVHGTLRTLEGENRCNGVLACAWAMLLIRRAWRVHCGNT